jgi:hypothetical protein
MSFFSGEEGLFIKVFKKKKGLHLINICEKLFDTLFIMETILLGVFSSLVTK